MLFQHSRSWSGPAGRPAMHMHLLKVNRPTHTSLETREPTSSSWKPITEKKNFLASVHAVAVLQVAIIKAAVKCHSMSGPVSHCGQLLCHTGVLGVQESWDGKKCIGGVGHSEFV